MFVFAPLPVIASANVSCLPPLDIVVEADALPGGLHGDGEAPRFDCRGVRLPSCFAGGVIGCDACLLAGVGESVLRLL